MGCEEDYGNAQNGEPDGSPNEKQNGHLGYVGFTLTLATKRLKRTLATPTPPLS